MKVYERICRTFARSLQLDPVEAKKNQVLLEETLKSLPLKATIHEDSIPHRIMLKMEFGTAWITVFYDRFELCIPGRPGMHETLYRALNAEETMA